jgi:flagellar motility protein MotE (MotC chaperone)
LAVRDQQPIQTLAQPRSTQTIQTEQIAPANPTFHLLSDTLSQLQQRKQTVEKELARFDDLRKELEAANAEIESLEKTLGLFESQSTADSSRGSRSR